MWGCLGHDFYIFAITVHLAYSMSPTQGLMGEGLASCRTCGGASDHVGQPCMIDLLQTVMRCAWPLCGWCEAVVGYLLLGCQTLLMMTLLGIGCLEFDSGMTGYCLPICIVLWNSIREK